MPTRVFDAPPARGLAGKVVRFANFLKERGFGVFRSSIHDALRGLELIDLSNKHDFLVVLRANMATNDMEWKQFLDLFDEFWGRKPEEREVSEEEEESFGPQEEDACAEESVLKDMLEKEAEDAADRDKKECIEGVTYSPLRKLEKKDLACFHKEDIQIALLAIKKMIASFKVYASRRSKRSPKRGDIDFPRVMRKSMKTGGLPMALFYKERKKRLKRLVVLADVSGSMDRYARFVMPFLLGLRGIGSKAEVFVFSTSLTPITPVVRHLDLERALERIAHEVPDWSGGTRIGYSLHQFNQQQGRRLLSRRTVVLILSDGWDLGGKQILKREMTTLSRKSHCLIWLNPLAGDPGYQPVCQGMGVALRHVDYFLPAHSLENLKQVGRLLSKVMVH